MLLRLQPNFGRRDARLVDELVSTLPRLRRYARILTNDTDLADDLVAGTLAYAQRTGHIPLPRAGGIVQQFSILRRVYLDQFASPPLERASSRGAPTRHAAIGLETEGTMGHVDPQNRNETVQRMLSLSLEDREIIMLVAVERLSYEDIATLLKIPIATVLTRLGKARASIRDHRGDIAATPGKGS
jgi:RNA polymerase sigma-70 factor (ECF subfamily)